MVHYNDVLNTINMRNNNLTTFQKLSNAKQIAIAEKFINSLPKKEQEKARKEILK